MKTGCVVVTYNRLELLKQNINALERQTYNLSKIYIVNNCSTDGTGDYLAQYANNPLFEIITLDKNIGGAGGFSIGIKKAVQIFCIGSCKKSVPPGLLRCFIFSLRFLCWSYWSMWC